MGEKSVPAKVFKLLFSVVVSMMMVLQAHASDYGIMPAGIVHRKIVRYEKVIKKILRATEADFSQVPGKFMPAPDAVELMTTAPCKNEYTTLYILMDVIIFPDEEGAKIRMMQWKSELANLSGGRVMNFHGHQALFYPGGLNGSVNADASFFWRVGANVFQIEGPANCIPYLSVAETFYANAAGYGFIKDNTVTVADTDGDGVPDDADRCPRYKKRNSGGSERVSVYYSEHEGCS
ncbi:MAG: hypothetical protein GXP56_18060 [Deltaproteobacteria bacterium]|nr:hypothetical protein [Deltaproteobacteria bacterium]